MGYSIIPIRPYALDMIVLEHYTSSRTPLVVDDFIAFEDPNIWSLDYRSLRSVEAHKNYYRAQAAIGMIALFLLLSTNTLALYTFYHHRYVYKRLVACLFLVIGLLINLCLIIFL
ncbi:hypothetical protein DICVIV_10544 [Dictyocaulus viviparus]|uniref:Uncharacterized protein n=1 Tax=Dictyocaulus viviparus TaxID=29172 RepID=A0A0D8XI55_DICVI|nr:hypothetical protein DICVIV_10544 [Dictyocaulus viviparus]